MGGGSAPSSYQTGWNVSSPQLFNYTSLLPPWMQTAQQQLVPSLTQKALGGGMSTAERNLIWRDMLDQVGAGAESAKRGILNTLAGSGGSMKSPAAVSMMGDVENNRLLATQKAAAEFAKLRMGAQASSTKDALGAAFAQMPYAIGYHSQGGQSGGSKGATAPK